MPAYEPDGHWFDSHSGRMPGLRARSAVVAEWRARGNHTLMFLSLSFSFPSPLSENKYINSFKKEEIKGERSRSTGDCHGHVVLMVAHWSYSQIKEPCDVHQKEAVSRGEGVELRP